MLLQATFSLPAKHSQFTYAVEDRSSSLSSTIQHPVILVVEDNIGNFKLIARMLESLGAQCEWKTSGYEVVEFAETLPHIDLILMDIRLPYEDGYSAMRKIRQHAQYNGIPIIAVTANTGVEQMNQAKLAGFDGFIGKPLDVDRFPEQINRILSGQSVWEHN
ncbi:Signal transduction histidine-protein kinase BarA [bioreactor metagenome]|uniref:Signal transduction histidine-protein kinase BarA n=1 Tax=bioreactor metagenome TaxID=1076179 RepID=A0A645EZF4_9ZZZZ